MAAATTISTTTAPANISHFHRQFRHPSSPPCSFPFLSSPQSFPRLRICHKAPNLGHWVPYCCTTNPGINPSSTNDFPSKEASMNIQFPRRSLLVQFTCNACGESTKRLINRVAYERGTVFVQCSGCLQHHKLIDNLGLVVEYDFRNETAED